MWRDLKKSGIVFGAATAVFLFFYFLKMPLVALVCYTLATALLVMTLWARFGKTIGKYAFLLASGRVVCSRRGAADPCRLCVRVLGQLSLNLHCFASIMM